MATPSIFQYESNLADLSNTYTQDNATNQYARFGNVPVFIHCTNRLFAVDCASNAHARITVSTMGTITPELGGSNVYLGVNLSFSTTA